MPETLLGRARWTRSFRPAGWFGAMRRRTCRSHACRRGRHQFVARRAVVRHLDSASAAIVHDDPIPAEMLRAPDRERADRRAQTGPALGQRVFSPGRTIGIEMTANDLVVLQHLQAMGKDAGRDGSYDRGSGRSCASHPVCFLLRMPPVCSKACRPLADCAIDPSGAPGLINVSVARRAVRILGGSSAGTADTLNGRRRTEASASTAWRT